MNAPTNSANEDFQTGLTRSREAREEDQERERFDAEEISAMVVDAAFRVHRDLGSELLESVHESEGIKRIANNHHHFAASRLRVNHDCCFSS